METNTIVACLSSLSSIKNAPLKDLLLLTEKYPYASVAYSLIAKKKYVEDRSSEATRQSLKKAAIYAPSVEGLNHFLNSVLTFSASTQPSPNLRSKDVGTATRPPLKSPLLKTGAPSVRTPTTPPVNTRSRTPSPPAPRVNQTVEVKLDRSLRTMSPLAIPLLDWLGMKSFNSFIQSDKKSLPEDVIKHKVNLKEIEGLTFLEDEPEEIELEFNSNDNQDAIIGNFVKSNPRIHLYGEEPSPKPDVQTQELEFNLKIINENLVNIYLKQGLYKQAREMCQRLIDKNPDMEDHYTRKLREIDTLMAK